MKVLDLLNDFKAVNQDGRVFSHDGIDMNEYGHQVMSEILFQKLSEKLPTN